MLSSQVLLTVLLTLPPFWYDRDEGAEARRARLAEVAESIAAVASNRKEAAALIAVAWHESKLSAHVQTNRCSELPLGMRCDGGKARSLFQLHRAACPALWEAPTVLHTRIGAHCAMRLLRIFREQCGTEQGAFGLYAARSCLWERAPKRYSTMLAILEKLRKTNVKEKQRVRD